MSTRWDLRALAGLGEVRIMRGVLLDIGGAVCYHAFCTSGA